MPAPLLQRGTKLVRDNVYSYLVSGYIQLLHKVFQYYSAFEVDLQTLTDGETGLLSASLSAILFLRD